MQLTLFCLLLEFILVSMQIISAVLGSIGITNHGNGNEGTGTRVILNFWFAHFKIQSPLRMYSLHPSLFNNFPFWAIPFYILTSVVSFFLVTFLWPHTPIMFSLYCFTHLKNCVQALSSTSTGMEGVEHQYMVKIWIVKPGWEKELGICF